MLFNITEVYFTNSFYPTRDPILKGEAVKKYFLMAVAAVVAIFLLITGIGLITGFSKTQGGEVDVVRNGWTVRQQQHPTGDSAQLRTEVYRSVE